MPFVDLIGWTATAVFVGSYAFRHPDRLRQAQMVGAAIWIGYGTLMHAAPIIVANLLVLGAAGWASWRQSTRRPQVSASPARMVD
jgi:hypothetical protein